MTEPEIDEGIGYTGFEEALALVRSNIKPVATEELPLASCPGYVSTENVRALVDSPSRNTSLKDGFAVRAQDVVRASPRHPVELSLVGSVFAGGKLESLLPGQTVKVCSGAPVPVGADAVVAAEFCEEAGDKVFFRAGANQGGNIIRAGEDVRAGMEVVKKGQALLPARLAFASVAGITHLKVHRKPRFAIISIGDELIAPGQKLKEGQLYSSNSVNIGAWLSLLKIPFMTTITIDNSESIRKSLVKLSQETDAIITSGGTMHSERDLTVGVLDDLGWNMIFRHVRMGPGKGTSFGIWQGKPIFCLSGSPPSNGMAFLQLALPGILNMVGLSGSPLLTVPARLTHDVKGRHRAWAEFKEGRLMRDANGQFSVTPLPWKSRPKAMAEADCLLCKPEGVESLHRGQVVTVQLLVPVLAGALPEELQLSGG